MRKTLLPALLLLINLQATRAQHPQLRAEIARIAQTSKGKVGVAISLLETDDTLTYHNHQRYVLHSVAKLAIAITMLHEVDKGKFKLDQLIHINKEDLPPTYSPIREKYPNGNVSLSLEALLTYMVAVSDNNACDIILKLLGGTQPVETLVHNMGISAFALKASEAQMASAWPVQYTNWAEPYSQVELLRIIFRNSLLSKENNAYLWRTLLLTSTGPNRIKGLLPPGTPVGHKTGTSPVNEQGLAPATNDIGTIVLPNGKHLAIAVFITDSTDPAATRDLIIAKIAKAAHDEFIKKVTIDPDR